MKHPTRTGFAALCCMKSTCQDRHCPGRDLARLYQAEGGQQVDTHQAEREPRYLAIAMYLRFVLIVLTLVAAAAAQIYFF